MIKVISYSLYGDGERYLAGALRKPAGAREIFPDYEVWIYHDHTVPGFCLRRLRRWPNVRLIKSDMSAMAGPFWRFQAIDEADMVHLRDVDSPLLYRDAMLTRLWLETGKSLGILREHVFVDNLPRERALLRAGCFNVRGGLPGGRKIGELYAEWKSAGQDPYVFGADEFFLGQRVYPLFERDHVALIRSRQWQEKNGLPGHHVFSDGEFCLQSPETVDAGRQGICDDF